MSNGSIVKVSGPLVIAEGMRDANLFDVVRVSNERLIGEIIDIAVLVFFIMGIVRAAKLSDEPLPIIGDIHLIG